MMSRHSTALAVACTTVWMLCVACTPAPSKVQPASEVQNSAPDLAAISMEAAPGPEHNVFVRGKEPVLRLLIRNASAQEVLAPVQWTVTDYRGKEVHRSSETVKLAPQSSQEKEFMLPIAALGYFEAVFSVGGKTTMVPLAVLSDKPEATLPPGGLVGWPTSSEKTNPRAQAATLARTYLENMSARPVRPVHWEGSKIANPVAPTPEMVAQRTIAVLMEGATLRRMIAEDAPVRAYRFYKDGNKGPTWAIWSPIPCGPVAVRPLEMPVVITDLMGNSVGLKPRHDAVIIVPCETPVFVTLFTMEVMSVTPLLSVVEPPQKVYAGEPAQIAIEVWNPLNSVLKATASLSMPKGWTDSTQEATAQVAEGAKQRVTMKFTPSAESPAGRETVEVSIKFDRVEIPLAELPVAVEIQRHTAP